MILVHLVILVNLYSDSGLSFASNNSYDYVDAGESCCSGEYCESENYGNSGQFEESGDFCD